MLARRTTFVRGPSPSSVRFVRSTMDWRQTRLTSVPHCRERRRWRMASATEIIFTWRTSGLISKWDLNELITAYYPNFMLHLLFTLKVTVNILLLSMHCFTRSSAWLTGPVPSVTCMRCIDTVAVKQVPLKCCPVLKYIKNIPTTSNNGSFQMNNHTANHSTPWPEGARTICATMLRECA